MTRMDLRAPACAVARLEQPLRNDQPLPIVFDTQPPWPVTALEQHPHATACRLAKGTPLGG
jgi:hypothetical protein